MRVIGFHEPGAPVDRQGRRVISTGLDVEGANAVARGMGPHFLQRCLAQAGATKSRFDKEIIDDANHPPKVMLWHSVSTTYPTSLEPDWIIQMCPNRSSVRSEVNASVARCGFNVYGEPE